MLTPELTRARRSGTELKLKALSKKDCERAVVIAEQLLLVARAAVGLTRAELVEELSNVAHEPRDRRLRDALTKLVLDGCELSPPAELDAAALREAVFMRAARLRQELAPGARFSREQVLSDVAAERGSSVQQLDDDLYSDLKSEHRLLSAPRIAAAALVERYEQAERQAILLRAVRVVADVRCASPAQYRSLFGKLKFRRLLHRIEPLDGGGYRITIDGPFSLFEATTKYGLQLALVLPALEECQELSLMAELRWGPRRERLAFQYQNRAAGGGPSAAPLPDEVQELLDGIGRLDSPWRAEPASEIIDLPGEGVCVPDLVLWRGDERVFLEVMGYWSRDAVWRRVELAERGLPERIVFAVSKRLSVSEEVLDDVDSAALWVYKGALSPRGLVRRLQSLDNSRKKRKARRSADKIS
jgi:hypothetical protein